MSQTTEMPPGPQRLQALARANAVRLARAELKRRVAQGEISAAEVILDCPTEAGSWTVAELLMSQRRWGNTRCRKFLQRNQIGELKNIGSLTERQRGVLAAQLSLDDPSSLLQSGRFDEVPSEPPSLEAPTDLAPAPPALVDPREYELALA
jgi:hypothetical protein